MLTNQENCMPQIRYYNGREIKNTKRIVKDNKVFIRITYYADKKFKPGPQEVVTEEQYNRGRTLDYVAPKASTTVNSATDSN